MRLCTSPPPIGSRGAALHVELPSTAPRSRDHLARGLTTIRDYLHGDYLEEADRMPGSTVYCAFCDGFCLPAHLEEEHEMDKSFVRLEAGRKALYRTRQGSSRPVAAPNYFEGALEPT
jgi:hypothetical protein